MIEVVLAVPAKVDWTRAARIVEDACAAAGLQPRLAGTQASYRGSRHWHYARPKEAGTLEITLWPERGRLWFKVSAGRNAAWIQSLLPTLKTTIEAALRAAARAPTR